MSPETDALCETLTRDFDTMLVSVGPQNAVTHVLTMVLLHTGNLERQCNVLQELATAQNTNLVNAGREKRNLERALAALRSENARLCAASASQTTAMESAAGALEELMGKISKCDEPCWLRATHRHSLAKAEEALARLRECLPPR